MDERQSLNALRQRARRRLPALHRAASGRCHHCGCETVVVSSIPPERRLAKWTHHLRFLTADGERRRMAVATVDHLLAIRDGGDSDLSNLVLSCAQCNYTRAKQPRAAGNENCRRCGTPILRGRNCKDCRRILTAAWFAAHPRT